MNYRIKADRPTIVVGATLGLVLLFALYCIVSFWLMRQSYAAEIDRVMPRTARLLGIMENREALEQAAVEADAVLAAVAYSTDRDAAASAALMQQNVREVITGAGLTVAGSQILPRREAETHDRLRLGITVEGNVDSLDSALTDLELMRPLVLIESVRVKQTRGSSSRSKRRGASTGQPSGDPRRLEAKLELVALRVKG